MLQVEQSLALMESLWEPCDSLKSTVVQKNYFDCEILKSFTTKYIIHCVIILKQIIKHNTIVENIRFYNCDFKLGIE